MNEPATEQLEIGRSGEPPVGHTRRTRLLALSGLGIVLIAGLLLAMAQGAIAASFTIAGVAGKLSADRFVAQGVAQYPAVQNTEEAAVPVFTSGFRQAQAANFCFSVPVVDLAGVGPVVLRITTPGAEGFQADNLLTTAEQIDGDLVQRNVELGRDAGELDKGPAEATGRPGGFGLQSDTLEVDNIRIITRSVTAGTLRLNQVRIAIRAQERECY
ncbi:DUF6230 family protein [Actinomycetospora chibensis]|uniref:DUF6230 family protein n=1 Tax=Actinomycetospora chibensis TaxID=663606 RepID=A0ABV9RNU1_9PSEU|nr:DUF6230 family protein [Actinomycetospora chibensis]MDD7925184.1 DUF6230 family protein [Actinomycetospora chibensis]